MMQDYRNLLTSLVTRQLLLGQSAVVDGLATDEVLIEWRQRADVTARPSRQSSACAPTDRCTVSESNGASGTFRAGTRSIGPTSNGCVPTCRSSPLRT